MKTKTPRTLRYNATRSILTITDGKKIVEYHVTKLATDFGQGFRLDKLNPVKPGEDKVYSVLVDGDTGECNCKGHSRWQHCRHVEACRKLIELGRI